MKSKKKIGNRVILVDHSKFSSAGGAEKNGLRLTEELQNLTEKKFIIATSTGTLFVSLLRHLFLSQKIDAFLTFKGSAMWAKVFNLLGIRNISRVNNSPEAYLYWGGIRSVLSFYLRLKTKENDIQIFNSKKIMRFYTLDEKSKKKVFYLPNYYAPCMTFKENPIKNFILAARLSPEKQITETISIISKLELKMKRDLKVYTNKPDEAENFSPFEDLAIGYNDIYVSMALFEGMPNMVFEAISCGAAVILSNCWAHVELFDELQKFGLGNRVLIMDIENTNACGNRIDAFIQMIEHDKVQEVQSKTKVYFEMLDKQRKSTLLNIGALL